MPEQSRSRHKSPNPLTGEGYQERRVGIKTCFESSECKPKRTNEKKHFDIYYWRLWLSSIRVLLLDQDEKWIF